MMMTMMMTTMMTTMMMMMMITLDVLYVYDLYIYTYTPHTIGIHLFLSGWSQYGR